MKRLLALALTACMLVACAQLPSSGPVEDIPVSARPRQVDIAPEPPPANVEPARLVEGFLLAMAAPRAGYATARKYLTAEAARRWQPDSGAIVYDGTLHSHERSYEIRGVQLGTLDGSGRYTSDRRDLAHDFGLVKENNQWRIGSPPSGLLLSRYIFQRYYAHPTIYFISRTGGWVVPDIIHVPETLLTPERLVAAQLAGPSAAISESTRNALANIHSDALVSASIDADGIASVDFSDLPDVLPDDRRREIGAQLAWSFSSMPRMTGLRITVKGRPWVLPGQNAQGVVEFSSQQGYQVLSRATNPDLYAIRDGRAGRVTAAQAFLPFTMHDDMAELRFADIAVSVDGARCALVDASHSRLYTGPTDGPWNTEPLPIDHILDVHFAVDSLWVLGTTGSKTSLWRIDGNHAVEEIDVSGLPGKILRMAVSQTGTRAALIVQDGERTAMVIAALQYRGSGVRIVHTQNLTLSTEGGEALTAFTDVDISSETQLAVLARTAGGTSVYLVSFDGSLVEDLGPIRGEPEAVSALPRLGGDAIVARHQDGTVLRYEARVRWSPIEPKLSTVAYPG